MKYSFETDYNYQAMLAANRAASRLSGWRKNLLLRVAFALIAALFIVPAVMLCRLDGFHFVVVLPMLLGTVMLLYALFLNGLRAWIAVKFLMKGNTLHRIEFHRNGYQVITHSSQEEFDYSSIWHVTETKQYFLLFLDQRHIHILDKSGLGQKSLEQFRSFLAERVTCEQNWSGQQAEEA